MAVLRSNLIFALTTLTMVLAKGGQENETEAVKIRSDDEFLPANYTEKVTFSKYRSAMASKRHHIFVANSERSKYIDDIVDQDFSIPGYITVQRDYHQFPYGSTISRINVESVKANNHGSVAIMKGGIGFDYISLMFESEYNQTLKYKIQINVS